MKKFVFYINPAGELKEELVCEINAGDNEEEIVEEIFARGNENREGIVSIVELNADSIEEAINLIHKKYDNDLIVSSNKSIIRS